MSHKYVEMSDEEFNNLPEKEKQKLEDDYDKFCEEESAFEEDLDHMDYDLLDDYESYAKDRPY